MKQPSRLIEAFKAVLNVGLGYLKAQLIFFCINFGVMTVCFAIQRNDAHLYLATTTAT